MRLVAFITGSCSGNGRGMALELARRGYDIALHHSGRAPENAETIRAEIAALGVRVEIFAEDLTREGAAARLFAQFGEKFDRLDLFVNNAGITVLGALLDMPEEDFDRIQKLNWHAAVFCVREAGRFMKEHGCRGSIVIIASNHHDRTWPRAFAYGSMKEALRRYTEYAALELSPYGIRVNCLAPGYIDREYDVTDARRALYARVVEGIPMKRWVKSSELAGIADFLTSPVAASITGVTMDVDGGDRLLNDAPEAYGLRGKE